MVSTTFGYGAEEAKETVKTPTGLEWIQESMGKRFDDIVAAMLILSQNQVSMRQTPYEYYDAVEKRLKRDPRLYDLRLTTILADHLYENEAESRSALDRIRKVG